MFNKESRLEKFKDAETIIGASIKVKGNFQGQGNIIIEGALEGSLKTDSNLFIGEKARVVANVESRDAIINGEVKGNIKAKGYLALGSSAKIFGDIQYSELSIEKGAIINGQLLALAEEHRKNENRNPESDKKNTEE
ncbi:polymer-forming cytoskeletal protein [Candidatus Falkowbacteria bacterium]|jgi:cytoskeletal protein CcmA (bactofilin family)|nr:polymer-forming cytoskeletal protein [Candidatus Falkowbacteria bacterium]